MNKQELLALVAATLSIEEILDLLDWTTEDLVETLADEIYYKREAFEEAL